jgi:hypothetical protein
VSNGQQYGERSRPLYSFSASLRRAFQRIGSFFRERQLDSELDEEMAAHIDMAIAENLRRGLPQQEARRQAMIRFGGAMQAKEHQRETRGLPGLDILIQDLSYALRTLRRDTAFTVIAVLILAIGIGANVVVFSVVNTILLRPLPLGDPARLVRLGPITGNIRRHVVGYLFVQCL